MTTEEFFKRGRPSLEQKPTPKPKPHPQAPKQEQPDPDDDIVINYGVRMVAPKRKGDFLRLSDKTIINIKDIILVNVEKAPDGSESYRLFLEGKHMTLKLSHGDFEFINESLMEDIYADDDE